MKLQEVLKTSENLSEAFTSFREMKQSNKNMDSLEDAYDDIFLLRQTFKNKDFGILIGKPHKLLDEGDIFEIKRKIADIVRNNALFSKSDIAGGKDGWERMRLFGSALEHGLEFTASVALVGIFGYIAIILGPAVIAGTATLGAILGFVGATGLAATLGFSAKNQLEIMKSLKSASRLLKIVDVYEKFNTKTIKINPRGRIVKSLTKRTPEQVKKEGQKKIKKVAAKAKKEFDKVLKGLPKRIEYVDSDGDIQEYLVVDFFNF